MAYEYINVSEPVGNVQLVELDGRLGGTSSLENNN
jgi:hypothetical protein